MAEIPRAAEISENLRYFFYSNLGVWKGVRVGLPLLVKPFSTVYYYLIFHPSYGPYVDRLAPSLWYNKTNLLLVHILILTEIKRFKEYLRLISE